MGPTANLKVTDWRDSRLTFCYYDTNPTDNFSKISSITVQDEMRQFIGTGFETNIIATLEDIRRETGRFHFIRIYERAIREIYSDKNGVWFFNQMCTDRIYESEWDATTIYHSAGRYYDGHPSRPMRSKPDYQVKVMNGDNQFEDVISFSGRKPDNLSDAARADWWPTNSYNKGLDTSPTIINLKNSWDSSIELWREVVANPEATRDQINEALRDCENAYISYVQAIESALAQEVE